jgi:perosamine synthetase
MIPFAKPRYWGNEKIYLNDAFDSTWISEGIFNKWLEEEFEKEFDTNVLLTSNGTSALQLAFETLGLGEGDYVIFPGFCFQTAANVATQLGVIPEFVDVNLDSWNITSKEINKKLHDYVKAIVVVHNYGYPCDMDSIMELSNYYGIPIIEDCAEAIFSRYRNQYVGTFGDFSTFSFHATKTLTTGEGGMLICKWDADHNTAKLIRSHGLQTRGEYNHLLAGNNFRMSNLHAAIGYAQLEKIDEITLRKKIIIQRYVRRLMNQDGIRFRNPFESTEYVLWSFPVRLDLSIYKQGRDRVIEQLKERGIETRPGFVPASKLDYFGAEKLLNSEILGNEVLVFPSFFSITEKEIDYVCSSLLDLRS